jgi:hypothetical protein
MAFVSNPETLWLGLHEKTDSVDCCKIFVSLDFCLLFYQENCAAINEAKKIINIELKVKAFRSFGMGANPKGE